MNIYVSQPNGTQPLSAYKIVFPSSGWHSDFCSSPSCLTIVNLYAPESFTFFTVPLSNMHTSPYEKVPSNHLNPSCFLGPRRHHSPDHGGLPQTLHLSTQWASSSEFRYALDSGPTNLDTSLYTAIHTVQLHDFPSTCCLFPQCHRHSTHHTDSEQVLADYDAFLFT